MRDFSPLVVFFVGLVGGVNAVNGWASDQVPGGGGG